MGAGQITPLTHYGPEWKAHRKLYQQMVGHKELSETVLHTSDDESRALIERLEVDSSKTLDEVKLCDALSSALRVD